MTTYERNTLAEQHQKLIWYTVGKNRTLLIALGLETDDVFQDLYVEMLRAIERFDETKGCKLTTYITKMLQYAVLGMRRNLKPHGITGQHNRELACVSLDYRAFVPENENTEGRDLADSVLVFDDYSEINVSDIYSILNGHESEVAQRKVEGINPRKKVDKACLESARQKIAELYLSV